MSMVANECREGIVQKPKAKQRMERIIELRNVPSQGVQRVYDAQHELIRLRVKHEIICCTFDVKNH
jgi:hypothetical protein